MKLNIRQKCSLAILAPLVAYSTTQIIVHQINKNNKPSTETVKDLPNMSNPIIVDESLQEVLDIVNNDSTKSRKFYGSFESL